MAALRTAHCTLHLSAAASAPVLATLLKARVDVDAQLPVVELGAVERGDGVVRVLAGVEEHKGKAAGRLGVSIEADDHARHRPDLGEELEDLEATCGARRRDGV